MHDFTETELRYLVETPRFKSVKQIENLAEFKASSKKYVRLGKLSAGNSKSWTQGYTIYAVRINGGVSVFWLPYCDGSNSWVSAKCRSWNL